jgi:hypothetical protein
VGITFRVVKVLNLLIEEYGVLGAARKLVVWYLWLTAASLVIFALIGAGYGVAALIP